MFHDWHFSTATHPSPANIINLKPYRAYIRIGTPENTYLLRTVPAPNPSPKTRATILERSRRENEAKEAATKRKQQEEAVRQRQAEPPPQPQPEAKEERPPEPPPPTVRQAHGKPERRTSKRAERVRILTNQEPAEKPPEKDEEFSF